MTTNTCSKQVSAYDFLVHGGNESSKNCNAFMEERGIVIVAEVADLLSVARNVRTNGSGGVAARPLKRIIR